MADFSVKPLEAALDFAHLPYWDVVIVGAGPAGKIALIGDKITQAARTRKPRA